MDKSKIKSFLMIYGKGTKLWESKFKEEQYGLTDSDIRYMKSERLIIPTSVDGQYIVTQTAHDFVWSN